MLKKIIDIGKTETGKLYHILDVFGGSEFMSICGCFMPEELRDETLNAFELEKEGKMCEKCMYSRYYKQDRD